MFKIKELRLNKRLSQMQLAKKAGLSQSFIHDLETGSKDATSKTLRKIAQALDVSISELLDEDQTTA